MKKILILLLTLFITKGIAQVVLSTDTLEWRISKPITWDEFKATSLEGASATGELFCYNYANYIRKNAFSEVRYIVIALVDRTKSWVPPAAKTKKALVYFQTMFDLYEVHARRLRKDLSTIGEVNDVGTIFQTKYGESLAAINADRELFKSETKLGSDAKQLKKWKAKIAKELIDLEEFKK